MKKIEISKENIVSKTKLNFTCTKQNRFASLTLKVSEDLSVKFQLNQQVMPPASFDKSFEKWGKSVIDIYLDLQFLCFMKSYKLFTLKYIIF